MLFMVVETFLRGPDPVGVRFRAQGRMMPEGLIYHASWLEPDGSRCFQLMEADSIADFEPWTSQWSDLMAFEIMPVLTSLDFWARRAGQGGSQP